METDVTDVLIDLILNGSSENVDVCQDIVYSEPNALETKLEMILLKLVM